MPVGFAPTEDRTPRGALTSRLNDGRGRRPKADVYALLAGVIFYLLNDSNNSLVSFLSLTSAQEPLSGNPVLQYPALFLKSNSAW